MNDLFSKILVFDLDDTLVDTQAIKNVLFNYVLGIGCSGEQNLEIYKEIRDSGFTLEKYAAVLSRVVQKPTEEILSGMRTEFIRNKDKFLSKDVRGFLELCRARGVKMNLLTFGASDWQAEKIKMVGLNEYFDEHSFTNNEATGKIEELEKIVEKAGGDGQIVLFNDKLTEIIGALKRFPGMRAFLRPIRLTDGELFKKMDPILKERIEVLPNFRLLIPEMYDGVKK